MNFQFSFSNKNELIYVENKPETEPIGSLLRQIVDANWSAIGTLAKTCFYEQNRHDAAMILKVKQAILEELSHPAISYILQNAVDSDALISEIERLNTGSQMISYILEALVDEVQNSYEECLLSIIGTKEDSEIKNFFDSLGIANMLSVKERVKPLYHSMEEFPFLFESNDIMTLAIQELQFMCSNRFYIRKCALCKKFFWTRKMNKIYCDRMVPNTKKTCSQTGPTKVWMDKNPKAYALYWAYRKRLFNRATNEGNDYYYHQWLNETEAYRDKARKNEIAFEEMKGVLDEIESRVYKQAVGQ